jgi:hypothetical protein
MAGIIPGSNRPGGGAARTGFGVECPSCSPSDSDASEAELAGANAAANGERVGEPPFDEESREREEVGAGAALSTATFTRVRSIRTRGLL